MNRNSNAIANASSRANVSLREPAFLAELQLAASALSLIHISEPTRPY